MNVTGYRRLPYERASRAIVCHSKDPSGLPLHKSGNISDGQKQQRNMNMYTLLQYCSYIYILVYFTCMYVLLIFFLKITCIIHNILYIFIYCATGTRTFVHSNGKNIIRRSRKVIYLVLKIVYKCSRGKCMTIAIFADFFCKRDNHHTHRNLQTNID